MGFNVIARVESEEFAAKLASLFEEQPIDLQLPQNFDWSDKRALEKYGEQYRPSAFVHAVFPSARPLCESEMSREKDALANILRLCETCQIPLLFFSSHSIFGEQSVAAELTESVAPQPDNVSGAHLLVMEQMCARLPMHIILRLSWLLDGVDNSLLSTIVPKLLGGDELYVSDHSYGRPVSLGFLANVVLAMIQQILCGAENWGAFHVRASDQCSEAEFCDAVVRLLNADNADRAVMPPVSSKGDNRKTMPNNALLFGERCTDNFGIQLPSWRKGLKGLLSTYLSKSES